MLPRRFRLKGKKALEETFAGGRRIRKPYFLLVVRREEAAPLRIAVLASRKLRTSVRRNRAKRRLRAAAASLLPSLAQGHALILIATPASLETPFSDLVAQLRAACIEANALREETGASEKAQPAIPGALPTLQSGGSGDH